MEKNSALNVLHTACGNEIEPYTNRPYSDYISDIVYKHEEYVIILDYTSSILQNDKEKITDSAKCLEAKLRKNHNLNFIIVTTSSIKHIAEPAKNKPKCVRKMVIIASGKGGVGKSTIAANIAVKLLHCGYKVGLLDADIYGPSIPAIFNTHDVVNLDVHDNIMEPITSNGLKIMSMGFLIKKSTAAIWRGPMTTKALHQLIMMTNWGELDYLIVDTPPGTGDIHLSLAEKYEIDGAIIVTTPQALATIDAERMVDMLNKVNIKIYGIVNNMAFIKVNGFFLEPFGKEEHINLLIQANTRNIISLPIDPKIQDLNTAKVIDKELYQITQWLCH